MKKSVVISLCLVLLIHSGDLKSQTIYSGTLLECSVTYIANSGFLLRSGGKSVLIDALFNNGFGRYAVPSNELKADMINGKPPFEKIDLFLVTHNHGDHFVQKDNKDVDFSYEYEPVSDIWTEKTGIPSPRFEVASAVILGAAVADRSTGI